MNENETRSKDELSFRENMQNATGNVLSSFDKKRNLIGFWILGLCNNFAYVIMLSAAHDILKEQEKGAEVHHNETTTTEPVDEHYMQCNEISTGAILLADILPTLIIKLTAPFYIHHISYRVRVAIVVLFNLSSFLLVGFSVGIWMSILGVVCASICGGLGEVTYMSLSAFFDRNVISTYSSGTGGAGVFGALSYAGLTSAGLSPRNTLFVMTIIPVTMAISYFGILKKPDNMYTKTVTDGTSDDTTALLDDSKEVSTKIDLSLKDRLRLLRPLLKYMIPLILVYFAEYFINQGLMEILYFNNISWSISEQYRWYQVDYQLGVFISRSSVNFFEVKRLWVLPIIQFINLGILLTQVFYRYIPNIAIIFVIIFFEGLLGGAAFVNTFYQISKEIRAEYREYSLGAATIADSFGISVAGAVSIPSHNHICSLHLKVM
ncbi:battenin [Mytilus galloprovincialis]|uniref:Battenin n=1 Tax=Mytilus galloprovincialis TaxID=29158 RepID=A0A8B6E302_MYTGA|nr:battenin [Mytilus galloprovincialis]